MNFQDNSKKEWEEFENNEKNIDIAKSWFNDISLDYWRHHRMRSILQPLIKKSLNKKWLTVGDGRYGTDGYWLKQMGAEYVHCSDLSSALLQKSYDQKYIDSFSEENAENLSFPDNSFDFVFCKEAYHHIPRPYVALHEMFRCCRKAVILIEPRDRVSGSLKNAFETVIRKILGKAGMDQFEPVGNYIYSISERELEKFLLGMHYRHIAYFPLNDHYFEGIEFIQKDSKKFTDIVKIFKLKSLIFIKNLLSRVGLIESLLLASIIFKEQPVPELIADLKDAGWIVKTLPKNPYR